MQDAVSTDQTDKADYVDYADYAEYAGYAEYAEYAECAECAGYAKYAEELTADGACHCPVGSIRPFLTLLYPGFKYLGKASMEGG